MSGLTSHSIHVPPLHISGRGGPQPTHDTIVQGNECHHLEVSGQRGKESGSKAIKINPSGGNALLSPWLINIIR